MTNNYAYAGERRSGRVVIAWPHLYVKSSADTRVIITAVRSTPTVQMCVVAVNYFSKPSIAFRSHRGYYYSRVPITIRARPETGSRFPPSAGPSSAQPGGVLFLSEIKRARRRTEETDSRNFGGNRDAYSYIFYGYPTRRYLLMNNKYSN